MITKTTKHIIIIMMSPWVIARQTKQKQQQQNNNKTTTTTTSTTTYTLTTFLKDSVWKHPSNFSSERNKSIANNLAILPVQIVKVKTNIKAWTGSLQAMLNYLVQRVKVLTYIYGDLVYSSAIYLSL